MPKNNFGIALFFFGLLLLLAGIFLVFYEQTIDVYGIATIEVSSYPFQLLGFSSAILGILCVAIGGYKWQKSPSEISETNVESPKPRVKEAHSHPPPEGSWVCLMCRRLNPEYIAEGEKLHYCMYCGAPKPLKHV